MQCLLALSYFVFGNVFLLVFQFVYYTYILNYLPITNKIILALVKFRAYIAILNYNMTSIGI